MTFKDWLFSSTPNNPKINGQWGPLHIATLVLCIAIIVTLALTLRKKSEKARKVVLWVLAGVILFFEISRRIINFCKGNFTSVGDVLHTLLPRPWCAISCWCIMAAPIVNKKWYYNFASITALLCALIFFSYPGVGFNNKYLEFENIYSISTHALLLISSISIITLKFADFKYKGCWKELIAIACVYVYAFIEIWLLKIESDPLYFMPGNDIMDILGISYAAFLAIYIGFMCVYFNIFYLIGDRKSVAAAFKRNKKSVEKSA